jgi:hypothetical protein
MRDELIFRIQPAEGIALSFSTMRPGMNLVLQSVRMDFTYKESFTSGAGPCAFSASRLAKWSATGFAAVAWWQGRSSSSAIQHCSGASPRRWPVSRTGELTACPVPQSAP